MSRPSRTIYALGAAGVLLAGTLVAGPVGAAGRIRTSGSGSWLDVSWVEYDPDNRLGLPGNVHVGFLYGGQSPWGDYLFGSVTDFDCKPGQVWWGGHGHGVVDEGAELVADATEGALEDIVDSGATRIDGTLVVDAVAEEIVEEIPEIIDEFLPNPCTWIQDRFLDGSGTTKITVDTKKATASVTGKVTVHGGHGPDGEPGQVLGSPPISITISGGEWSTYEYAYSSRSATHRFSHSEQGKSWFGGTVSGRIGAMGFDDDADDESWAGFTGYSFKTVERLR